MRITKVIGQKAMVIRNQRNETKLPTIPPLVFGSGFVV